MASGVSAVANSSLLKGTAIGAAADLAATIAMAHTSWQGIAVDAAVELVWGIYKGKPVSELDNLVVKTIKKSSKTTVDNVVDKTMNLVKTSDKDWVNKCKNISSFTSELKKARKQKCSNKDQGVFNVFRELPKKHYSGNAVYSYGVYSF